MMLVRAALLGLLLVIAVQAKAGWEDQERAYAEQEANEAEMEYMNQLSQNNFANLAGHTGAVYTRWGRDVCPGHSILIYGGFAAGQFYSHRGGASNPLCLPRAPQYHSGAVSAFRENYIYGAEYQSRAQRHLLDQNVPCAVCMARGKTTTFMIPAATSCPHGTVTEYTGTLSSGHFNHQREEFTCLDGEPTGIPGSGRNTDGYLFYAVGAECGRGLPCPPYRSRVGLSCAVCSV